MIDQSKRTLLSYWWTVPVAGTAAAFAYMGWYAQRVTFDKRRAGEPQFQAGQRQRVAAITALSGPYSSQEFSYAGRPCLLMELPEANLSSVSVQGRHFVAYSRLCTHQGCTVIPIQDTELLALSYNYRAGHPMLGCPCHFSVFDPQDNGESVFGKALFALPRVELLAQDEVLYAVGIERDPRQSREP